MTVRVDADKAELSPVEQPVRARRPKILHVMTVAQSLMLLEGQVRFMAEQGFDVLAATAPGSYTAVFTDREGIVVEPVSMTREITPLGDLAALWDLVWMMRRVRPTIVHAHTPKAGLLGMIAATIARVPVRIYHMRGLPLETARGARHLFLALSERVACGLADRVFMVSHSLRDTALRSRLVRADKVRVFFGGSGNGVDGASRWAPDEAFQVERVTFRDAHRIPPDAVVIGYVGRLSREKGVPELAEAWLTLRDRFPGAYFVLAGPQEPRDGIPPALTMRLEGDPRVRMLGLLVEMRPVYAGSDVIVLPSHREGFPNVPLEAAALERPVVTTLAVGCRDAVVPGVTGMQVPVGDVDALVEAIARYLGSAELRLAHGRAGRRRVLAEFSQQRIWAAYRDQYCELLAAARQQLPLAI